jgi:molybdopterin converting factor small subunit
MQILVKLYATLREFAPLGIPLGQAFEIELNGEILRDLVEQLGIPSEEAYIVIVNGIAVSDLDRRLQPRDMVVIFPRIGGGGDLPDLARSLF